MLCIALCPLVLETLRRRALVDHPTHRSSHTSPTPRGGGVAPAIAGLAALALAAPLGAFRLPLLVLTGGFGLIGLVEDLAGVPVLPRLALQAAVAGVGSFALLQGGPVWWLPVAVLWVVAYTNAFNFMDGINGISAAQALSAGVVWFLVGSAERIEELIALGLIAGALALAYVPFNFPVARFFLGDVGSLFFGALLAATVLIGVQGGIAPEAMAAPLAPYLADTAATLLRRLRRGENLTTPHKEHAYQRLVAAGLSHVQVTLLVLALTLACGFLGLLTLNASLGGRILADLGIVLLVIGYLWSPRMVR